MEPFDLYIFISRTLSSQSNLKALHPSLSLPRNVWNKPCVLWRQRKDFSSSKALSGNWLSACIRLRWLASITHSKHEDKCWSQFAGLSCLQLWVTLSLADISRLTVLQCTQLSLANTKWYLECLESWWLIPSRILWSLRLLISLIWDKRIHNSLSRQDTVTSSTFLPSFQS